MFTSPNEIAPFQTERIITLTSPFTHAENVFRNPHPSQTVIALGVRLNPRSPTTPSDMKPLPIVLFALVVAFGLSAAAADEPAFPGAQGFGAATPGGRGGQIVRVTTLAASGGGSLREALAAKGPRI